MCYDFQPKEKAGKTGVCILFEHLEKKNTQPFPLYQIGKG